MGATPPFDDIPRHCEERRNIRRLIVIARSTCDEAIQFFLAARELLRGARNDVGGSFANSSSSLRGALATKQSSSFLRLLGCFAEPVIGRAFARPPGSRGRWGVCREHSNSPIRGGRARHQT